VVCVDVCKRIL